MSSTAPARAAALGALLSLSLVLSGCLYSLIPADGARSSQSDDDAAETVYTVDSSGTLTPAPTEEAAEIWEVFERVATPSYAARMVSEFEITDDPLSEFSATVSREDESDSWMLSAELYLADDRDALLSVMVHEYGHLLSLSTGEVPPQPGTCATLELYEGCAKESSAIYRFEQEFWAQYTDAPPPDNDDEDVALDFLDGREDDFVDDYAARNIVEDFAETFMVFVFEPGFQGPSLAARKVKFFWDRPDYVEIRDRIRTEFRL